MIVTATPRLKRILSEVWRPLLVLLVWDIVVTLTYFTIGFSAPELPLPLFGNAIAS